jgi:hypothetical protein
MMTRRKRVTKNIWAMPDAIHKFPSTPHLFRLGQADVRDDKVLTPDEARSFLSGPVVVEEKVDGANLGLSFDSDGTLRFQNRGNWLEGKFTGQWERLRGWASKCEPQLREILPVHHVLFGEWCFATHSIHYDQLPDWFLVFDVFDATVEKFWNTTRRNSLAAAAKLSVVPKVAQGVFKREEIEDMLDGRSDFSDGVREGLYFRRENEKWLLKRAKLVRPGFTQAISEHWSRQVITPNKIGRPLPH